MLEVSAPVATLVAALIGGLFLLHVHRLNAFRAASTKFRAAVLEIFKAIYPAPSRWPENVDSFLRNVLPGLQSAVTEFRSFLPWYRQRAFDRAWFRYRCATGRKIDIQCYHHYMDFSDQPDPKETFKRNVDAMLSFAKQP